ncbi:MAG: branched-chain amino acid ABC transporter permease [Betaproteobacteria bacterium]|jgi:branched-chain amino acid transport system permease protein|nr:branched-chain amino acid ABC transporter permease [Betaproteobacteria bacterium]
MMHADSPTISTSADSLASPSARFRTTLQFLVPTVLAALLIGSTTQQYHLDLLFQVLLGALLASAWNIVGGYAGQIALGHAGFYAIGAYTSTILLLRFGISPWIGMLAGAALAALCAAILGILTLRLRGPFFAMSTVAFAEIVRLTATHWDSVTGGTRGLWISWKPDAWLMGFSDRRAYALVALGLLVLVTAVSFAIARSKLGYLLRAIGSDEDAARSVGVRSSAAKVLAFSISGAFTAMAGTLSAQYALSIDPPTFSSFEISIQAALLSAVGGMGTIAGPIVGAVTMVTTSNLLRSTLGGQFGALHLLIYGIALVLVMLFMRGGIVGLWTRVAKRRHVLKP